MGKIVKPKLDQSLYYNKTLYLLYFIFILVWTLITIYNFIFEDINYFRNFNSSCVNSFTQDLAIIDRASQVSISIYLPQIIKSIIFSPFDFINGNSLNYLIFNIYKVTFIITFCILYYLFYKQSNKSSDYWKFSDNDLSNENLKDGTYNYHISFSRIITFGNDLLGNFIIYLNLNSFTVFTISLLSLFFGSYIYSLVGIYDPGLKCFKVNISANLFELNLFSRLSLLFNFIIFIYILLTFLVFYIYNYRSLPKIKIFIKRYKKLIDNFWNWKFNKKTLEEEILKKEIYNYSNNYIDVEVNNTLRVIQIIFKDQKQKISIERYPNISSIDINQIKNNKEILRKLFFRQIDYKFEKKNKEIDDEDNIFYIREKTTGEFALQIILLFLFIIEFLILIILFISSFIAFLFSIINRNNLTTFDINSNLWIYFFAIFIFFSIILDISRFILFWKLRKSLKEVGHFKKKNLKLTINTEDDNLKKQEEEQIIEENNINIKNETSLLEDLKEPSITKIWDKKKFRDNFKRKVTLVFEEEKKKLEDIKEINEENILPEIKKQAKENKLNKQQTWILNENFVDNNKFKIQEFRQKKFVDNEDNLVLNQFLKPKYDKHYKIQNKDIDNLF